MRAGIIGFPKSGRKTVFKALTGVEPPSEKGIVKVRDERLSKLAEILSPKKVTPVEIEYVRFDKSPKDFGKYEGIKGRFLLDLSQVDLLVHVVRAFEDPSVPHVDGDVDPERDIRAMELELIMSDLLVIERRLERIDSRLKGGKGAERDMLLREKEFLTGLKRVLEDERPLRSLSLRRDEEKMIAGYGFLSLKPILLIINMGEEMIGKDAEEALRGKFSEPGVELVSFFGKAEAELSELEDGEREEMREAMGIPKGGSEKVLDRSLKALDLITFFTAVSDELRAWPVKRGTKVINAAGKIHSDMERGFIKAEVISYEDLVACGGFGEARRRGLIRTEGRDYEVRDGDIIKVLFNI